MTDGTSAARSVVVKLDQLARMFVTLLAMPLACLPVDTRPPPATVLVRVTGSPLIRDGIASTSTTDGWSISFERFLVSLGETALDGASCVPYSDAGYSRIFDGRTLAPQKVSVLYGLGACDFRFLVKNPDASTVLSAGVTESDRQAMRVPGSDRHAGPDVAGISILVKGRARRGAIEKTFTWAFRPPTVLYQDCTTVDPDLPIKLSLQTKGSVTVDIQLHGEALFQDKLDPAKAKLRFTPFADADEKVGNADGEVTLDELALLSLDLASVSASDLTAAGTPKPLPTWTTFEDFVYLGLFPQVVRLADRGVCTASVNPPEEN